MLVKLAVQLHEAQLILLEMVDHLLRRVGSSWLLLLGLLLL